jgi:hypothetical protein
VRCGMEDAVRVKASTPPHARLCHMRQSFNFRLLDTAPSPETRHSAGLRRGCRQLAHEFRRQMQRAPDARQHRPLQRLLDRRCHLVSD